MPAPSYAESIRYVEDMRGRFGSYEARFMSKVIYRPDIGCLVWTGRTDHQGYAKFETGPKDAQKHWRGSRFALYLSGVDIDNDLVVMHTCDNGMLGCVDPDHLKLGTSIQNRADCVNKRRHNYGAKNRTAKITDEIAITIYQLWSSGHSINDLMTAFGVSRGIIQYLVSRKTWRHVDVLRPIGVRWN